MPEPQSYVGRYRLVSRIGGGAMGDVYAAEDSLLERTVAVKLAKTQDGHGRMRFLDEARLAARVVHPNLVSIFDIGVEGETAYLAMELVHGVPLTALLRRGPSDWMVVASIGLAVSAGLAALHDAGLMHRDIKPGNLMLGVGGAVKIVDFGIAAPESTLERDAIVGSPGYIAPEVVLGASPKRSVDVFALGVVLHELAMGRRLFAGATAIERTLAVTQGVAPRLPSEHAPEWFLDLIASCLEPDPDLRFPHARDVHALLKAREPFADLKRSATSSAPIDDEVATTPSMPTSFVGEVPEWIVGHRGRAAWVHGPHGVGKTRLIQELAARCDAGGVLVVEEARDSTPLAQALGLESLSDASALAEALHALAPVLIVFEDVPTTGVGLQLMARVRPHAPDAVIVITSTFVPDPHPLVSPHEVSLLSDREAERFLLERLAGAHATWVKNAVPLAGGVPLCLELLARSLGDGGALLAQARGGLFHALLEHAFLGLSPEMRGIAELLAVGPVSATLLIDRADEALGMLWALGLAERRESGMAIHGAFRDAVLERLVRDGRAEGMRRALSDRLHRRLRGLYAEADGPTAEDALRGLVALRPLVTHEVERALREGRGLEEAALLLSLVIDPSLPRFDGALVLLHVLITRLEQGGALASSVALAHLTRAWAHEDDLVASLADAERALEDPALEDRALAVRGSVLKRMGRDVDAREVFVRLEAVARARGNESHALLSRWELVVNDVQRGVFDGPREVLLREGLRPIVGRLGPRILVLQILVAMELGELSSGAVAASLAIEGGRALGQTRFAVIGLEYLLEIHLRHHDFDAAERAGRQALVLARAANLRLISGHAHGLLGLLCLLRGQLEEALRLTREGHRRLAEVTRHPGQLALYRTFERMALALAGSFEGLAELETLEQAVMGTSYAPAIALYASLVRGAADPDRLEVLDALLEAGLPPGANAELALAHTVAAVIRPRLPGPRSTWHGHG